MTKLFPILTYALYWLLFFFFVFDYTNYNQGLMDLVTDIWCCVYVGYFLVLFVIDHKKIDSFTFAVFITLLMLACLDLLWYNTDFGTEKYFTEYKVTYFSILVYTFVLNALFKNEIIKRHNN